MKADFESQLDEQPTDWSLRLIYADWLEDEDDDLACRCQRWMAEHEKAPYRRDQERYHWSALGRDYYKRPLFWYEIPEQVLRELPAGGWGNVISRWYSRRWFKSRVAAELALSNALRECGYPEA